MTILSLTTDVLSFMQLAADDSFGNVAATHNAVESLVKTYTDRNFEQATYREILYDYRGGDFILKNRPVTAINLVTSSFIPALSIINSTAVTKAVVTISATVMTLTCNGVASSITLANYATLAALSAYINTVGNGWEADTMGGYDNASPTALLLSSGENVINGIPAYFEIPGAHEGYIPVDATSGVFSKDLNPVYRQYSVDVLGRAGGHRLFVEYVAGYSSGTVPADLKYAMLMLCSYLYTQNKNSMVGVSHFSIAEYAVTYGVTHKALPIEVAMIFDKYKEIYV